MNTATRDLALLHVLHKAGKSVAVPDLVDTAARIPAQATLARRAAVEAQIEAAKAAGTLVMLRRPPSPSPLYLFLNSDGSRLRKPRLRTIIHRVLDRLETAGLVKSIRRAGKRGPVRHVAIADPQRVADLLDGLRGETETTRN